MNMDIDFSSTATKKYKVKKGERKSEIEKCGRYWNRR